MQDFALLRRIALAGAILVANTARGADAPSAVSSGAGKAAATRLAAAAAAKDTPGAGQPGEPADDDSPPPPRSDDPNAENYRPLNREPRLINGAPPEYPVAFAGSGVTAEVMVTMMVDRMGHASHVRIEDSPDEAFTDAALDALSKWEFLPAIKRGKTTNTPMRLTMLVREEIGDSAYFDYTGGRIALDGTRYAGEYDYPVRRLFGLRPVYPFDMLADGKPGEVVVEFTVGDDGEPHETKIIESTHKEFSLATQGALAHWRYSPAMRKGMTIPVRMRYRISFQPEEYSDDLKRLAKGLQAGTSDGLVSAKVLDRQPRVLRVIEPVAPSDAGGARSRRRVVVNIVVNENGEVVLPRVQSASDPLSGYIALAAVSYWRFAPALKNKQAVPVEVAFPVSF